MTGLRVIVAEDALFVREGIVRVLESAGREVVGQAGDADELLALVASKRPDVVVTDVHMPPSHSDEGLRAARRIREHFPDIGVLILSEDVDETAAADLLSAVTSGLGYLLKGRVTAPRALVEAVDRIAAGESVLDPEVVARLLGRSRTKNPLDSLTPREREVLGLMAQGRSNAGIATDLVITERAVEKHVGNVFGKLGLPQAPNDHRRVLAVIAFLRASP